MLGSVDLLTSLSKVMVHCRMFGRTSPTGEKDSISGGATINKKQKGTMQRVQNIFPVHNAKK